MDSRPAQGKDAEGPDDPLKIQHLPLRRLQGEGRRPAGARHSRQRRDDGHRRGDAGERPISPAPHKQQILAERLRSWYVLFWAGVNGAFRIDAGRRGASPRIFLRRPVVLKHGVSRWIRHCERSDAIQSWGQAPQLSLDCFAVARNDVWRFCQNSKCSGAQAAKICASFGAQVPEIAQCRTNVRNARDLAKPQNYAVMPVAFV